MSAITAPAGPSVDARADPFAVNSNWSPPLSLPRLYFLILGTFNLFSFVLIYRTARDLRNHTGARFYPWLYPLSLLTPITVTFAMARLAGHSNRALQERGQPGGTGAGTIAALTLLIYLAIAIAGASSWYTPTALLMLVVPLPWMLLQRMTNRLKPAAASSRFTSPADRYTGWQITALVIGGLVWALSLFAVRAELARLQGVSLQAGEYFTDPESRYAFRATVPGWRMVRAGTVIDDATVELLGPNGSDWAVLRIEHQPGFTLDDAIGFRYEEIAGVGSFRFSEQRRLLPGTEQAISYASYEGGRVMGSIVSFHVTTLIDADLDEFVEFIVYTAGSARHRAAGDSLAYSLVPYSSISE